jgi:hypothetical protein
MMGINTRISIALQLAESTDNEYLSFFIINYISSDIKKINKIFDISRARDVLFKIKTIDTVSLIKFLHYGV